VIFFNFYLERWVTAVQGMTAAEEGAYLRLVLWCYANESELPLDMKECFRIARCENRDDREIVSRLLSHKFNGTSTGFIQGQTAIEIDKYKRGTPARENRRVAETERKRASRAEQAKLYADARQRGLATRPGMKLSELRELLGLGQVVPLRPVSCPAGQPQGQTGQVDNVHVSMNHSAILGETLSSHLVRTTGQNGSPNDTVQDLEMREIRGAGGDGPLDPVAAVPNAEPERIAAAVRALKAGGLQGINAGHPLLHALVAAGASPDAFTYAAAHAAARSKGFAYALAVVQGQMQDAALAQAQGLAKPAERNRVSEWAPGLEATI
jgi:uncharacterized protein YdaU (DUF1376 family)